MNDKYLTVTALTKYIKYKLESDNNLKKVYLKGEISNFKAHSTGHFYFSIKDENSIIRAIMFNSNAKKLNFIPTEGMKILVTGTISVYPATGSYQIYVDDLIEDGINGYLCRDNSVGEYAEKIEAIIKNNKLKEELYRNNKRKIAMFDIRKIEKKIKNIETVPSILVIFLTFFFSGNIDINNDNSSK